MVAADTLFTSNVVIEGNLQVVGEILGFSDRRLKSDIAPIQNSLEKVKRMHGCSFLKSGASTKSIGLVAQEVQEVLPEVVFQNANGLLSVAYGNITALLIEAVKELSDKIEKMESHKKK